MCPFTPTGTSSDENSIGLMEDKPVDNKKYISKVHVFVLLFELNSILISPLRNLASQEYDIQHLPHHGLQRFNSRTTSRDFSLITAILSFDWFTWLATNFDAKN